MEEMKVTFQTPTYRNRTCLCFLLFAGITVAVAFSGCSSSDSPSGPSTAVGDLYIAGFYFFFPGGPPDGAGVSNGAGVIVRDGGETGPVVSDLDVTINGHELTFSQSLGVYVGVSSALASGDNMTIVVSDGLGSVSETVQVPYPPSNLELLNGWWDVSGPLSVNTLSWNNPVVVGQALVSVVYDYSSATGLTSTLYNSETSQSTATVLDIRNNELTYYFGMSSATCVVCQANYLEFPSNPGNSVLVVATGVWGNWPCGTPGEGEQGRAAATSED